MSSSVPTFAGTAAGAGAPAPVDDGPRAGLLFVAAGIILLFLVLRRAQRRNARETRDAGRPPRRFPGRP